MNTLTAPSPRPAARNAPRSRAALLSLTVVTGFLAVNALGLTPFRWLAGSWSGWPRVGALAAVGYGLYLLVPLAVGMAFFGVQGGLARLGLSHRPGPAFAFAAVCSAPVLLGIASSAAPVPLATLPLEWMRQAVLPGIAEELLFRAFLFGLLFRDARWGFLPAALLSALVFGLEHLYQAHDPLQALGIALLTGLGGLWWSWLLVEWRWNLWVPIAFHVLLNGYWTTFDVADNALGSAASVVLRVACIALSVAWTVRHARRHGGLQLRGHRWWRGPLPQPVVFPVYAAPATPPPSTAHAHASRT